MSTEKKERVFKDVIVATNNASKHHHDNVVTYSLIRYQEKKKNSYIAVNLPYFYNLLL